MIHATAVVHAKAQLHPTVDVGPFAVIDEGVVLGPECIVGPHVHLTGQTTIGARNRFHTGCVIGDAPQDLKYHGEPTRLRIGDGNVFRENVTVHRSNKLTEDTVVGSNNFLMAGSHVGHNAILGNHVILANGVLLAGHVTVADRVFISGNCLVHQFVRIGTLALMQGGSAISKDLPPFTIAHKVNEICGLNVVGMRRAGYSSEQRLEVKKLYHALFRSGRNFREAVADAQTLFMNDAARVMLDFVSNAKRGVVMDAGFHPGAETEGE
ncbi:MAG: acyl-ACP--UDP-N-acetylglucosamine O-acyltransferase [Verrucomicrobiota bacterium]